MKRDKFETECGRVIRRLAVRGARLKSDGAGAYLLESVAPGGSPDRLAAAIVDALYARDFLADDGGVLVLSEAGRSHLRRLLAGADGYRAQHQTLAPSTIVDDDGGARRVVVDHGESPLARLRHRRGRDGRPLIDPVEFAAGERLRVDFERGRMLPRITANWATPTGGRSASGGRGGIADLTEAGIAARRRVERALDAVGPELSGLLVDFCCFLKGLEAIERERQWPARSAKLVLRLGLTALARHYGIAAKARGRARAGGIVHWGVDGYRPSID